MCVHLCASTNLSPSHVVALYRARQVEVQFGRTRALAVVSATVAQPCVRGHHHHFTITTIAAASPAFLDALAASLCSVVRFALLPRCCCCFVCAVRVRACSCVRAACAPRVCVRACVHSCACAAVTMTGPPRAS